MDDRYKILVVDDELQILASLKRILNDEPYCILSTDSPVEAIEILQKNKIDVMVSDQRMPDISGLELLKYSKTISPGTVRILMTGYSDIGVVISLINEGDIFYYISKPWDNENFKTVVKKAVEYSSEQNKKEKLLNAAISYNNHWSEVLEKMKTQLAECNQQSMSALANVIKAKDINLYNHSDRVAQYALKIADRLGLEEQQKQNIEYASYLHDIGKIGIKDNILDKPGKLNEGEYNEIKRHPAVGAEIIKEIESFKEISEIISQHHERVDGGGYPRGLSDSEIRIEAKIIAIADAYDALTCDRVYRGKLSSEVACSILRTGKNKLYDPHIVDIFLEGLSG
ncbi:MAG: HD domain-containing protein [Clostridiaceae bacterium]|jgi:putative nucleotidyltransferase with HDIG domain|nr:HD domain-containing protein [Clostridiaceae bacterium]